MAKKAKALVLMSGGLDSMLAAKLVMKQGIKSEGIHFNDPFSANENADKASKQLGMRIHRVSRTRELIRCLKRPRHGYGSNANPCIDCRILSFRKAWRFAKAHGFGFLVTGEVLGQRPMSQKYPELMLIEKQAGVRGNVLRPLSARLLPQTRPEKTGWVDRGKLLDISGRSRKIQMALAKKYKIRDYPTPAGGCLLTDPSYARRVFDLLKHDKLTETNFMLLKVGRHFRAGRSKIIVGRDEEENEEMERLAGKIRPAPAMLMAAGFAGPTTVVMNPSQSSLKVATRLTVRYSDAKGGAGVDVLHKGRHRQIKAEPATQEEIEKIRI